MLLLVASQKTDGSTFNLCSNIEKIFRVEWIQFGGSLLQNPFQSHHDSLSEKAFIDGCHDMKQWGADIENK
jgi:hypothetical protein